MEREFEAARKLVEERLATFFEREAPQHRLFEAMRYSLLAGGKRIRPVMVLKFAEACGGSAETALPAACAVEMIHTYSLIHDDLPCMDNDVLRRGKPTNHVVYGECTATLAGDALQAAAFEVLLSAELSCDRLVAAARVLARAAGEMGICGGQQLDMEGEGKTLGMDGVAVIHELKTAGMIRAAAMMGVIVGGGTDRQLQAADRYAQAVGLAFQMRDDILNCTSTAEEMGKSVGTDMASGKSTFVSLLGLPACERLVAEKTEEAKSAVREAFDKPEFFCWLADMLASRAN